MGQRSNQRSEERKMKAKVKVNVKQVIGPGFVVCAFLRMCIGAGRHHTRLLACSDLSAEVTERL